MRIVDLSLPLKNQPGSRPVVSYQDHAASAAERAETFGFDVDALPEPGVHMAHERFDVGTHTGATHVDAPWHYGPSSEGRPARRIDEVPLEWFHAPAVVLDVTDVAAGATLGQDDVAERLRALDHDLRPLDAVLLRTGADRLYGSPAYFEASRGLSREAVLWLVDQGVRVLGTDAFSLDPPIEPMVEALKRGDTAAYFPAHLAGREREFCIVEKLANLDRLPPLGARLVAFPVSVEHGSGGWCRAVGLLDG